MDRLNERAEIEGITGDTYLDKLEQSVIKKYDVLKSNTENYRELLLKHYNLIENKKVFQLIQPYLPKSFNMYVEAGKEDKGEDGFSSALKFHYICGVLKTEEIGRFQRIIFRVSRGNSFLNIIDVALEKDQSGKFIN